MLVYQEFMNEVGTTSPISTGSVIMIAISSAILMAQRIYLATSPMLRLHPNPLRSSIHPPGKAGIVSYAAVLIFMAFVPHLTVIITSFLQWSSGIVRPIFTLGNYERLFNLQLSSIYVSLFLGIVTTILNVVIGVAIAYIIVRKRYRIVSNLSTSGDDPYIVPGTVLAIGFIMIFNQPPLRLRVPGPFSSSVLRKEALLGKDR